MHDVTPSYLLLEPQPGREGDVLDALSRLSEVAAIQELFGSQKVAARLEVEDDLEQTASELEGLESVRWACLYGGEGTDEARMPLKASG